jgi:hypothetical protein
LSADFAGMAIAWRLGECHVGDHAALDRHGRLEVSIERIGDRAGIGAILILVGVPGAVATGV